MNSLVTFTEEIRNEKLHFFVQCDCLIRNEVIMFLINILQNRYHLIDINNEKSNLISLISVFSKMPNFSFIGWGIVNFYIKFSLDPSAFEGGCISVILAKQRH